MSSQLVDNPHRTKRPSASSQHTYVPRSARIGSDLSCRALIKQSSKSFPAFNRTPSLALHLSKSQTDTSDSDVVWCRLRWAKGCHRTASRFERRGKKPFGIIFFHSVEWGQYGMGLSQYSPSRIIISLDSGRCEAACNCLSPHLPMPSTLRLRQ
ncbi:hypothetical protein PtA15_5A796 [Puccinia triticina]|uniref:Uncharacterized protein n=1 Tax=Puccinia triticina TaxID=208348 RepID=A0ABY7CL73_9BASI|nr:uncharacterized protein PtA15_5A796 [Puccinia triticina]WAQ85222.1 hypothetical protein PtA15_5A796 [Puccinia triticina]